MTRYDIYQSNAAEVPLMRKWMLRALFLSLLLHGVLFAFFQMKKLENFGPPPTERLAPPLRVFKRVNIPEIPKDNEEARLRLPEKVPNVARLEAPSEKPQAQELRIAPQMPETPQALLNDKPKADLNGADIFAKAEAQSRGAMEKEMNSISGSLFDKSARNPRQPTIKLPASSKLGNGGRGDREGIPGLKTIDEALAVTGPLPAGDKAIGMPGGALYEYDSAELKFEAIEQLQKLGELIRRNPKATFSIEGHTDSFGSPEYNIKLSERRAEAVRDWLVLNMSISPQRIQTKGLGSSRLLVPATKSVEEQAPNRRVEIVIKTNRK